MHRVLVPLDGSPFSESALLLAGEIAERTGRNLELVTVKPSVGHLDTPPGMCATIESAGGVHARLYLDRQAQELHRRFEVGVHSAVLDGPVPSAIVEHAHYDPPDLIVMSTHGRSGPARLFSGSVADRLLRALHYPFILVRPGSALAAGQLFAQPRVLVALDGSPLAESVVDEVSRFFPCEVTTLRLLRVITPAEVFPVGAPTAEAYLESTASKLRQLGWQVEHEVVIGWHPSVEVLRSAVVHRCDLVAMATRGLGGVQRMFLGSVADKVIRCAATPVLVVNPSAGASSRVLGEHLAAATAGHPLEAGAGLSTALR